MLKRWMFWLPALYLGIVCVAAIDMALGATGGGEGNYGAWIFFLCLIPALALVSGLGGGVDILESNLLMAGAVLVQTLLLLALGAAVDRILRRRGRSLDEAADRT